MQEVADAEFEVLASFMEVGSYTANQVFDHFCTIQKNNENAMWNEMQQTKKPNGDNWTKSELNDYCDAHRSETLSPECMEEVAVSVDSFKCNMPRYILFKILHKFEQLAGIKTKDRKKFIREANMDKEADVSFIVEITKPMMALTKVLPGKKEPREQMKRIALDFDKGFVVACDGCMMSVMNAVFRQKEIKEGAKLEPVLLSPDTFKHCEGNTMVTMSEINGCPHKYRVLTQGGAYYEEDTVGRYVAWRSVVPNEYFRSGRITLSKDGMKQLLKFAKLAEKNADTHGEGKDMVLQTEGDELIAFYMANEKMQTQTIHLGYEPAPITICLDPKFFKKLNGWNGTIWISGYGRAVIFDCEDFANFHLVMPRMLPDGIDVQEGLNGTKVSFEERHSEYLQPQKQQTKTPKKQTELQTETKINNPITPIFMAEERYEGTEPFYQLDKIENGEFSVKGNHDSDLVLFLRTAAHYIRRQGEMMQSEFCAYCSKQLEGKDWRSMVPMEELALAEMFEGFLASKGVNDIPDVEFEDVMEEVTEEVVEEVVEEPIAEVEEAEEVEEVKAEEVEDIQEAEEVIEDVSVKPMAIEKEIVPTLELETSEGTLIVAGDSYFHKLYDEENGCFRSEAAEAKFNEIDAFIPDELITAEVLDYAAIAQAVGEFMEEVEQAS